MFTASTKEDTVPELSCSPSKIKKENVPISASELQQHSSPRKHCKVNFENGGILKDVQNSPLKDRRRSDVGPIVESTYNDIHGNRASRDGDSDNFVASRSDLVLPVSPRKKIASASSHKRALTFNFQNDSNGECYNTIINCLIFIECYSCSSLLCFVWPYDTGDVNGYLLK